MKLIRAAAIALSIVLLLCSCGNDKFKDPLAENPELLDEVENTWVPILSEEECLETLGLGNSKDTIPMSTNLRSRNYGSFLFFPGYYTYKTVSGKEDKQYMLLRYDMRTGETYPACRDSACLHRDESCPLNLGNLSQYIIVDNIMYLLTFEATDTGKVDTSKKGGVYSYNLDTLEYKLLFERETGVLSYFDYYDGKLYFVQYEYADESNKHDKYIWSFDLKSKKKEKLFKFGDETDTTFSGRDPLLIDEKGRMVFINYIDFDATDLSGDSTIAIEYAELKKGAKITRSAKISGYFSLFSYKTLHYANGRIFYNEQLSEEEISYHSQGKDRTKTAVRFGIKYIEVETGKTGYIDENVNCGIGIAGDYLYYTAHEPEIIDLGEDKKAYCRGRQKVTQYSLKTGDKKTFDIGNLEIATSDTYYYRGRLFTYVYDRTVGTEYPVEIDLTTGQSREIPHNLLQLEMNIG